MIIISLQSKYQRRKKNPHFGNSQLRQTTNTQAIKCSCYETRILIEKEKNVFKNNNISKYNLTAP